MNLSHNGLDGALIVESDMAKVLPDCRHLTSLDLSDNPIKEAGMVAIATASFRCRKLVYLNLGNCQVIGHELEFQ